MNAALISNYHTHTSKCNHAFGTEEEYILRAIDKGVRVLGFSDHSTYLFSTPFHSSHRMKPEQIDEYVSTLKSLREKYKDKIEIHIGFEVEYYPEIWESSLSHWREHGIEYLILGQHYTGSEEHGAPSAFLPSGSEDALKTYSSLVTEAIRTGKISCVAHPDVMNFTGSLDAYRREMLKIIECAKKFDVPLEYNLLGIYRKRHYPRNEFWELVKDCGNKVILGCDAHRVEEIADPTSVLIARNSLQKLGISNIVENITFKSI